MVYSECPCLYPGHVTVILKADLNSAGCHVPFSAPAPIRPHCHVAPSESLGLRDSVSCSGPALLQQVLGMFGILGRFSLHFFPAGVGRSVHEITNVPDCGLHPSPPAHAATLSCFCSHSIYSLVQLHLKHRSRTHSGVGWPFVSLVGSQEGSVRYGTTCQSQRVALWSQWAM